MKLLDIFRKRPVAESTSGSFSDFLLSASHDEKKRVFREAAERSNEDQRALLHQNG